MPSKTALALCAAAACLGSTQTAHAARLGLERNGKVAELTVTGGGFSWSDCGGGGAALSVQKMSVSPDPGTAKPCAQESSYYSARVCEAVRPFRVWKADVVCASCQSLA